MSSLFVTHVVPSLAAAYGGPAYSVPRLCQALGADADVKTTLLSVVDSCEEPSEQSREGFRNISFVHDYSHIPLVRTLRLSKSLKCALDECASEADVVHNHGLWVMPNIQAGWAARRAGKPLIIAPRGMLSPVALSFSRRKKRVIWRLAQGAVVRGAACIHATSEAEYQDVRAAGIFNPVAVIPNGIDLPMQDEKVTWARGAERIVLSLGRIHPKKGLDRLLRAWAKVEAEIPGWRLRIVGPAEMGHDEALRALVKEFGLSRVTIEDAIYGGDKLRAYRGADLFVLPTLNENFGLTVAESLAAGTPVISTTGAPWSGLETEGCGWWIDQGVEPLAASLATAMAQPRWALKAMGAKGRAWMERDFSWMRVAGDMLDVYSWLTKSTGAPPTIRLD